MQKNTFITVPDGLGEWLCPLEDAHRTVGVGGKAANLARMIDMGIRVPPGVVLTDAAFQVFIEENGLRKPLTQALHGLKLNMESLNTASATIRREIMGSQLPQAVLNGLRQFMESGLPHTNLVVRSSAVGEDSHQAAFAGQLDSFLNIRSESALVTALLGCWASYWSARVLFYQHSKQVFLQGMGVIIQQQVDARVSGILFTRNPDSNSAEPDALLLEYCAGLGDRLANGSLNPGRWIIDRQTLAWRRHSQLDNQADQPSVEQHLSSQVGCLSKIGLQLEAGLGCPQDIEWTIDSQSHLYIVQTRPITVAPAGSASSAGSAASAGPGDNDQSGSRPSAQVLWSNANVNENYPQPITPLLYSIASAGYYNYFRNLALALGFDAGRVALMEHPLRHVIGVHGARMYYNLSNIHLLLSMAPCGEHLAKWFDDFVGVEHSASQADGTLPASLRPGRVARWFELCRTACKSTWQLMLLEKRVTAFECRVAEFAQRAQPEHLQHMSLNELLSQLRGFIDIRCNHWTDAALADTAAMVSYGLLKQLLRGEFQAAEETGIHNSLLKGLRDVASGQPIEELWKLSRMIRDCPPLRDLLADDDDEAILQQLRSQQRFADFRRALDDYLRDWGFRFSGELMLTEASYQERPQALLELLRAYVSVQDEASPQSQLDGQAQDRLLATAKVIERLRHRRLVSWLPWPSKASALKFVLPACHKSIAWRERARLKQAQLYGCCRHIALTIGDRLVESGQLDEREDIFFLTYQEVDTHLAGSAMFAHQTREMIALRRAGHQQLSELNPSDSFVLPVGEYLPAQIASNHADLNCSSPATPPSLTGVGACGGRVRARATILNDISECGLLNEGDVLVARQTDPGWGPLFFLIKGLVMERGGMLSHGAILAREYGIPTVLGIPQATQRIRSGQIIEVNGDSGIVQLVD